MKKRILIYLFVVIPLVFFLSNGVSLSGKELRTALVIGNGKYKKSSLKNPENDANDVGKALEKCGFTVTKVVNADRKKMRNAIRDFGKKIKKGGVGLFYYAGHGIQVKGENYLVPIGADVDSEAEVPDECLLVSSVLRQMDSAGNSLNIIILDACRDNPFGRSFRSSKAGLAKMDAPTGSFLAYATAPGSVAADGTGRNGLYTSKLLKHMMTPGLGIEKVFKQVRIEVIKSSGKKQTPWESSSLIGDFYFKEKRGVVVTKSKDISKKGETGIAEERKKLEDERKELERIKAEVEEKKRLEEEREEIKREKEKLLEEAKHATIEDLNKTVEMNPDDPGVYNNRGLYYLMRREYERAIKDFGRAIDLDHGDPFFHINRGIAHVGLEQYERAVENYNFAIKLDPENIFPYQKLSEVGILAGDYRAAMETALKALTVPAEIEDHVICQYFILIAGRMLKENTDQCERDFHEMLKNNFRVHWDFEPIEKWLRTAHMPDHDRQFIAFQTERLIRRVE